jgi:hypothetical protein
MLSRPRINDSGKSAALPLWPPSGAVNTQDCHTHLFPDTFTLILLPHHTPSSSHFNLDVYQHVSDRAMAEHRSLPSPQSPGRQAVSTQTSLSRMRTLPVTRLW